MIRKWLWLHALKPVVGLGVDDDVIFERLRETFPEDWLKDGRLGELVRGLLEKAGAKVEPHAGPVVVGSYTIPGRVLGWFDTFSDAWGVASATGASIIREGLGVGKFLVWK